MSPTIALWGGIECTVNRVGDRYLDQVVFSGHEERLDDLDRFAELGITAIRYPILWERTDRGDRFDWHFADERLGRLRALGIEPIVTLVHHGSGPRWTSLLDDGFPEGLARFARAVAERYPWVKKWTPVNEPLTTARFSGLYGHWYPHRRDDHSFVKALSTEIAGTVRAMEEIRAVAPDAELVTTEDLAHVFSTPHLRYQAEFEDHRRWLSLDLLTGRFGPDHPLYGHLLAWGGDERLFARLRERPCPPTIVGLNYYMTSDRFLDERIDRYPPHTHGGNGRERYADVEAVRVLEDGVVGHERALLEAHDRYALPVAITELHLGCTREEQLRWMQEAWTGAQAAKAKGADVRAVTIWSLLGAFHWNTLVTRDDGSYEPGAFDVRSGRPRPTALAEATKQLATIGRVDHPVVDDPGWWRRPERLLHPIDDETCERARSQARARRGRPILIVGAGGTLGRAFVRACEGRGLAAIPCGRKELDLTSRQAISDALAAIQPWAVVNAAGYVRVDDAEVEPAKCFALNADGPAILAEACAKREIALATFSSDLVFDGKQRRPYRESDPVAPLGVYGRSKVDAEARVLAAHPRSLVIRTSAFFGPEDQHNFVTIALRVLGAGDRFRAAADAKVSPTYVPDLVDASLDLLVDRAHGIWHLANRGEITWAKLAEAAATARSIPLRGLEAVSTAELGLRAQRPLYSVLGSEQGAILPSFDDALARYLRATA
jgi:dTDP-4-dehydrorhamnose reductase